MWGDGSGTGTGGTFALPEGPLRMWKGKWDPMVYHFSSNWKELSTLKLSLEQMWHEDPASLQGVTVFYFTDNSGVYWISAAGSSSSPTLHDLIESIRLWEIELDCHLLGARMIPSTKSSSLFRPFAPSGLPSGSITHGT
jgi:hypothetical protein